MNTRPAFAESEDLAEWLGEDISTDQEDADRKRAQRCLRAASNLIRSQTGRDWTGEDGKLLDDLPEELQDVCLACAGRMYTNPNAETQWNLQTDDGMDGGSRKVEESGLYLTATEKATLSRLTARQSPVIAGIGVIGTTRSEAASSDMSREWSDDDHFLMARITG
ncbi:hypothetical protein [Bifidobacterium polysaccharolyticum]|uniref:Phage protein Gp19/Gp15/Gp42 n=1 Tax=Bifidobacterium polysaccharolyticum TaxID=2750967 RepID=A0ABS0QXM8_9BIFI|nr:hypothetical protein [Bifidobacterium polysaccharolyticum]